MVQSPRPARSRSASDLAAPRRPRWAQACGRRAAPPAGRTGRSDSTPVNRRTLLRVSRL